MGGLYGGIEAGGTKFVCAVTTDPPSDTRPALTRTTIPVSLINENGETTHRQPDDVINDVTTFFQEQEHLHGSLQAIGIGSFGPVDLALGAITTTPKPYWQDFAFVPHIKQQLRIDNVGFDTDTNSAALGEFYWGGAQGLENFIYLTVGTGIGGGGMVNGKLMHGLVHPEMGHMRLPRRGDDAYTGFCAYHRYDPDLGICLEGLACGEALKDRYQQPPDRFPPEAWDLEAHYLALAVANLICTLSPERIIMGGGVIMHQQHLLPAIRRKVQTFLNSYVKSALIVETIEEYIVVPALGDDAGVLGAVAQAYYGPYI